MPGRLAKRFAAAVPAVVITGAITGAIAGAASAATAAPTGAGGPIELQIVSQDAATPLDGRLALRLRITGPIGVGDAGEFDIRVIARERIDAIDELVASANGELGAFKDAVEFPLVTMPRYSNGDVVATVVLQPRDDDQDYTKLQVTTAGVYPLEVVVRDPDEDVVAQAVTWLVAVDEETVPSVSLAWIWSLASPPDVEADGVTPTDDFVRAVGPGGDLARTVEALELAAAVPITIAATPQTVDAWSRAADRDPDAAATYDALLSTLERGRHTLLAAPYVAIDGPAIERAGLGPRVPGSYLDGARALQDALGRRPDPSSVWLDPVDLASLGRTAEAFAYRAIVPFGALADSGAVPREPFTITTPSGEFTAVSTADDLALLLDGGGLPGLRAQRFFAALALVGAEREEPATVVLGPRRDGPPNPALVRSLLATLADQPVVAVEPANRLLGAVPPEHVLTLEPAIPGAESIRAGEVLEAEQTLATLTTLVGDQDPRVERGRANLRLVLASGVPVAEHRARLDAIGDDADAFLAGIGAEPKRVTLTDRRSAVPISFRNDTDRDVEVRVTLSSSKLTFPGTGGATRIISLPAGRNTTEEFTVEARTSGTFTMRVTITSVDGNLTVGAPATITVRSAVFGPVGTWLTYGAIVFLALWWGHHLWQSRRRARATT
jgi:hypothetical protein